MVIISSKESSFGYGAVVEWWIADHMKPPITTKICGSSSIGRAFNVIIRSIDNQTLLIDSSNLIALANIYIYI